MKTTYIKFFAPVNGNTVAQLLRAVEAALREGTKRFHILISSPGGTVFHGLSAYNFLKGIPAEVVTHNFGSVDSIGVVMYCAGSTRLCVPHARFLIHSVSMTFAQGASLEQPQLEEKLNGIRIDTENIAGVIAGTTMTEEDAVKAKMLLRTTMSPEEALDWGLVHEIREELFPSGASLISIEESSPSQAGNLPQQLQALIPGVRADSLN
jgi:ATP-dependent protease ClpP protease subunit